MADCLNEVNLVGSLAANPEIRNMADGRSVCNLRVVTTASWKDKNTGEPKSRTKYTSVVIWNNELVAQAQRLREGARVTLRGELQDRKYQERWVTEVVIQGFDGKFIPHTADVNGANQPIENRNSSPQRGQNSPQPGRNSMAARQMQATDWARDLDDELPFD